MSVATITQGTPLVAAAANTNVTNAETSPETAVLPEIADGSAATVAVGAEIRLLCTGGGTLRVETFDGRMVGIVPGFASAVVVAEAGSSESVKDFWRFRILPTAPADTEATPDAAACWAVLVANGFAQAESVA